MTRREIVKNIKQIQGLCESDSPRMAAIRLESLANEIESYDKQVSLWDRLTSK